MDSIVTSVIEQFKTRSQMGEKKYGVNMDRDDLSYKELPKDNFLLTTFYV